VLMVSSSFATQDTDDDSTSISSGSDFNEEEPGSALESVYTVIPSPPKIIPKTCEQGRARLVRELTRDNVECRHMLEDAERSVQSSMSRHTEESVPSFVPPESRVRKRIRDASGLVTIGFENVMVIFRIFHFMDVSM
jgi:hypothetical protein